MKRSSLSLAVLILTLTAGCGNESRADRSPSVPATAAIERTTQTKQAPSAPDYGKVVVTNRLDIDFSKHLVTFIELGADRCIPCKAMQPIMKEIAETYADRVQVVFYDVWKDPEPGRKYGIQLIPTQVFVDQKGNEIFRHVGLFPKEEILELLKKHGVH
ncbi:MAG TPA: thioredoxin family protein [Candidatus Latescibacteria bacterium]|nr:thioredoxin family protein [Candidatus Latescibacterota bacterium]